jgi:signal transduction histidine kinase
LSTEYTQEELKLWLDKSARDCGTLAMSVGFVVAGALAIAALIKILFQRDDPGFAHQMITLPIQIGFALGTGLALRMSAWVRSHAIGFALLMTMSVGGSGGIVLGGLGGFDGPFFYTIYILPSFIMLIPLALAPRIAATLAMLACFAACFMSQHRTFDPVQFDITVSTLFMTSVTCIFIGHRGWLTARQEFVATHRLDLDRTQARAQNVTLSSRLRGQARRAEALSRELDEAKVSERASIARDLHDDVGQLLVGARLELETLDRQLGAGERMGVAQVDRLQGVMEGLEGSVRAMISRLRDAEAPKDLGEALDGLARAHSSEVALELDPGALARLPLRARGVAYRVVQEGLTNAAKHSGGQGRWVTLSLEGESALLTVSDDGPNPLPEDCEHGGWGLLGLRERVEAVGGALTLDRADGRTRLRARLPVRPGHLSEVV